MDMEDRVELLSFEILPMRASLYGSFVTTERRQQWRSSVCAETDGRTDRR